MDRKPDKMTQINDIVLIHYEDQPMVFARVEGITPDYKKDWYHVRLLLLNLPLETVTWTLRNAYINGTEFTMGGHKVRLERVVAPPEPEADEPEPQTTGPASGAPRKKSDKPKVIPLSDRKPKS